MSAQLLRDQVAEMLTTERSPRERRRLGMRLLRAVRESVEAGERIDPADLRVVEAAMSEVHQAPHGGAA